MPGMPGLCGGLCAADPKHISSFKHRLRLWLDARYVVGDVGRSGRDSLSHLGIAAGSSPTGSPPCLPASHWPDDGLRSRRSLTLRMAASSGKESRGHSRNSRQQLTGTIPSTCNDSGAARSGRLPILFSSRNPTSSPPVGRGSGHGSAAQPCIGALTRKLGAMKGKRIISGKSCVPQDIPPTATIHTHQERRSIDIELAGLLPRSALSSATTSSRTAGMRSEPA